MSLRNEQNKLNQIGCSLDSFQNNSCRVSSLFKMLENADSILSAQVENQLVELGKDYLGQVVRCLGSSNSIIKKHAAMTLIRIGPDSIAPLMNEYGHRKELSWMTDFIIQEINCINEPG